MLWGVTFLRTISTRTSRIGGKHSHSWGKCFFISLMVRIFNPIYILLSNFTCWNSGVYIYVRRKVSPTECEEIKIPLGTRIISGTGSRDVEGYHLIKKKSTDKKNAHSAFHLIKQQQQQSGWKWIYGGENVWKHYQILKRAESVTEKEPS